MTAALDGKAMSSIRVNCDLYSSEIDEGDIVPDNGLYSIWVNGEFDSNQIDEKCHESMISILSGRTMDLRIEKKRASNSIWGSREFD
jgi:hypothetical protein